MHDIAIIGGGPGGLYAAHRLAAAGFDVVVFEEHSTAGEPVHCTGVLAAEAFEEFEIPRSAILNPLRTAQFVGPAGSSIEYSTTRVEAVVVDRRAFDAGLCATARDAGARILVGSRVHDVDVSDERVRVVFGDGGAVDARTCVLACGANYTLQRRLGLGMPAMYLQSAQLEVPAAAPGDVEIHFGDVAPKGFAWVVPVVRGGASYARIGLMCERRPREHFDRFLARVAPRWQIGVGSCANGASARAKLLPLSPIPKTFGRRLLAVGDAAGLVKATTGGGIYYSLLSATLAADVLGDALRHGNPSESTLQVYEQRWKAAIGDELSAQMLLRRTANRLTNDEIDDLFELARTDGIMPIVRQTARFNRHRELILSLLSHPPARRIFARRMLGWGRDAFARPSA